METPIPHTYHSTYICIHSRILNSMFFTMFRCCVFMINISYFPYFYLAIIYAFQSHFYNINCTPNRPNYSDSKYRFFYYVNAGLNENDLD